MKLRQRLTAFLSGCLAAALMLGVALPSLAEDVYQMIQVFPGVRVFVNNETLDAGDTHGNPDAFIYNGTTYVAVAAISKSLGKSVQWDGQNRYVHISDTAQDEINWMQELPPYMVDSETAVYDGTNPKKTFSVAGQSYTRGLVLNSRDSEYYPQEHYAIWNTNAKYQSMTFTICGMKDVNADFDVYIDGELQESYTLKWDDPPKTITVPLNYANNIKLALQKSGHPVYGIYNISFT